MIRTLSVDYSVEEVLFTDPEDEDNRDFYSRIRKIKQISYDHINNQKIEPLFKKAKILVIEILPSNFDLSEYQIMDYEKILIYQPNINRRLQ